MDGVVTWSKSSLVMHHIKEAAVSNGFKMETSIWRSSVNINVVFQKFYCYKKVNNFSFFI